jgi:hypothetical protein
MSSYLFFFSTRVSTYSEDKETLTRTIILRNTYEIVENEARFTDGDSRVWNGIPKDVEQVYVSDKFTFCLKAGLLPGVILGRKSTFQD